MPNWVYNEVEIAAPLSEVQAYLFEIDDPDCPGGRTHVFNLHQLFPERFDPEDAWGLIAWDYDWMADNVGTKWNPHIHSIAELEGHTHLGFESAWAAPNPLLARMHELTGWKMVNRHDDPDAEHDLLTTFEGGNCIEERLPGTTTCSNCDARW